MWQFKDKKDLVGIGFIDADMYVHSAKSLRGFVVTADVSRSVQLLRYQVSDTVIVVNVQEDIVQQC